MAIGDQVHWTGNAFNSDLRPSSGVEIILKDVTTSYYYTSGYHYYISLHYRTSGTYMSELVTVGGNSQYTGNGGQARASNYSMEYNPNMASAPINYSYYLRSMGYGGGYYHAGGYITKE